MIFVTKGGSLLLLEKDTVDDGFDKKCLGRGGREKKTIQIMARANLIQ